MMCTAKKFAYYDGGEGLRNRTVKNDFLRNK